MRLTNLVPILFVGNRLLAWKRLEAKLGHTGSVGTGAMQSV
jgi:hypothetical protein